MSAFAISKFFSDRIKDTLSIFSTSTDWPQTNVKLFENDCYELKLKWNVIHGDQEISLFEIDDESRIDASFMTTRIHLSMSILESKFPDYIQTKEYDWELRTDGHNIDFLNSRMEVVGYWLGAMIHLGSYLHPKQVVKSGE
ncbi:hypothetical protein ESZ50_02170 [Weissella muntiaci]|uniref:Uncharacterized protein n=1 Tax=Weissella muntiaci TaxID=2508881 RepID=A0A6C2CAZ8_9LACO|nr:hypothetical protein [Weissella muntiaci]TYC50493.1 hypothetical protein ESZ50_02170 [Weissella muntiaci]